ncbi:MAG: hypothetical protein IBX63_05585 [Coriobacteriia bacterium]|nr:hypothetical protein [Coriobacteriia bacterium]
MEALVNSRSLTIVLVIALLSLALVGQAGADALVPVIEKSGTGQAIERAGFAYLTGVRTYAAAVLWNRLDGLLHNYYEGVPLDQQTYIMPTLNMAIMLDPQLTPPYYVASWVLARQGAVDEGLALAARGVENNPRSGLLRVNYAQLLFLFGEDDAAAVAQAEAALAADVVWTDIVEQHDSYASVRAILLKAGKGERAALVEKEIERIDEEIDRLGLVVEHDHDH